MTTATHREAWPRPMRTPNHSWGSQAPGWYRQSPPHYQTWRDAPDTNATNAQKRNRYVSRYLPKGGRSGSGLTERSWFQAPAPAKQPVVEVNPQTPAKQKPAKRVEPKRSGKSSKNKCRYMYKESSPTLTKHSRSKQKTTKVSTVPRAYKRPREHKTDDPIEYYASRIEPISGIVSSSQNVFTATKPSTSFPYATATFRASEYVDPHSSQRWSLEFLSGSPVYVGVATEKGVTQAGTGNCEWTPQRVEGWLYGNCMDRIYGPYGRERQLSGSNRRNMKPGDIVSAELSDGKLSFFVTFKEGWEAGRIVQMGPTIDITDVVGDKPVALVVSLYPGLLGLVAGSARLLQS